VQAGAIVRASCRQEPIDPAPGVEYVRGDLQNPEVCARLARGTRYVFHLASIKGSVGLGLPRAADFFVKPLLMNTHMMEESRKAGVEAYLFASSVCVYAPAPVFFEDLAWDGAPHPSDAFAGWAKRMGEMQAATYREQYGWNNIAIIRPVNTYGPYDDFDPRTALVIPALIARVLAGENPLRVWGNGDAIRDFLHVRDAARAALLALEKSANGRPVNIGSGIGYSIREVVQAVLEATGAKPDVVWDTGRVTGEKYRVADIARARDTLGFNPEISLNQGIAETVRWYRENKERRELRRARFTDAA
jgi:GDP-L-fucose synthase